MNNWRMNDRSADRASALPDQELSPWIAPSFPATETAEGGAEEKNGNDALRAIMALMDQAICSLTNFVTLALLARSMTTSTFGVFSLAFFGCQFLRTLQERSLSAPYMVFVHRRDIASDRLLGSTLVWQSVFSCVGTLLMLLVGSVMYLQGQTAELAYTVLGLSLAIPFLLLRDQLRLACLTHFRMGAALSLDLAVAVIQLGGVGLLMWSGRVAIFPVILVLAAACCVAAVGWFLMRPIPFAVARNQIVSDGKMFWDFSRWLVAARVFGIGGQYVVPVLVFVFLNARAVASFSVCTGLVGISMMFVLGLNGFAQPRTVAAYQESGSAGMLRAVMLTIVCFVACLGSAAFVLLVFGDTLLGLVYGAPYAGNGLIAASLSFGILAVSISIAGQNGLAAMGKPHGFLFGEFSYFAVAVSIGLVAIPQWGLMGAAGALVAAGIAVAVLTMATLVWLVRCEEREASDRLSGASEPVPGDVVMPSGGSSIVTASTADVSGSAVPRQESR